MEIAYDRVGMRRIREGTEGRLAYANRRNAGSPLVETVVRLGSVTTVLDIVLAKVRNKCRTQHWKICQYLA